MLFRELLKNGKGIKFLINLQLPLGRNVSFNWGTNDSITPYFESTYEELLNTRIRLEPQEEPTDLPVVCLLDKINFADLEQIVDILSGREGAIRRKMLTGCLLPEETARRW